MLILNDYFVTEIYCLIYGVLTYAPLKLALQPLASNNLVSNFKLFKAEPHRNPGSTMVCKRNRKKINKYHNYYI